MRDVHKITLKNKKQSHTSSIPFEWGTDTHTKCTETTKQRQNCVFAFALFSHSPNPVEYFENITFSPFTYVHNHEQEHTTKIIIINYLVSEWNCPVCRYRGMCRNKMKCWQFDSLFFWVSGLLFYEKVVFGVFHPTNTGENYTDLGDLPVTPQYRLSDGLPASSFFSFFPILPNPFSKTLSLTRLTVPMHTFSMVGTCYHHLQTLSHMVPPTVGERHNHTHTDTPKEWRWKSSNCVKHISTNYLLCKL